MRLFEGEPNREDTIYRSKAVGEPPLMLAISVLHAIRDAVASCGAAGALPDLRAPATPEAVLRAIAAFAAGRLHEPAVGAARTPVAAVPGAAADRVAQAAARLAAALLQALQREPASSASCVAKVRGSAPREAGACMLVGA